MFTGIVRDVGRVVAREFDDTGGRIVVETRLDLTDLEIGESVAVDGACLTVVDQPAEDRFAVDLSAETLDRTTLDALELGDGVHLERALRVGDRLGGHFVQGHVDGVGRVTSVRVEGDNRVVTIEAPEGIERWLVPKGSIAVDGVSLTINEVDGAEFGVTIVPHTVEETKIGDYGEGDRVNVEADLLGKYATGEVAADAVESRPVEREATRE